VSDLPRPIVEVTGLSKSFGHVQALDDVSLTVNPREVLAIVGDNGAGKSTFIKILSGVYHPDAGTIAVDGEPVRFRSPADAVAVGIATVYQDLALVDTRDVAANLLLGREYTRGPFVDRRRCEEEARRVLRQLAADLPISRVPVGMLSGGQRQAVAIGRAIAQGGRVIVMDEPTAALGVAESARVLQLADDLSKHDKTVILISHNLQHVLQVADRIAVFHRGRLAGTRVKSQTTVQEVVQMILYGADRPVMATANGI
jgi:ABC-type sugar transport system ATPase subunit